MTFNILETAKQIPTWVYYSLLTFAVLTLMISPLVGLLASIGVAALTHKRLT